MPATKGIKAEDFAKRYERYVSRTLKQIDSDTVMRLSLPADLADNFARYEKSPGFDDHKKAVQDALVSSGRRAIFKAAGRDGFVSLKDAEKLPRDLRDNFVAATGLPLPATKNLAEAIGRHLDKVAAHTGSGPEFFGVQVVPFESGSARTAAKAVATLLSNGKSGLEVQIKSGWSQWMGEIEGLGHLTESDDWLPAMGLVRRHLSDLHTVIVSGNDVYKVALTGFDSRGRLLAVVADAS